MGPPPLGPTLDSSFEEAVGEDKRDITSPWALRPAFLQKTPSTESDEGKKRLRSSHKPPTFPMLDGSWVGLGEETLR